MKLKNALILSAAVVALGMGSVSISKAYAAEDKAAVSADVKTEAAKPVKKAAHHKHHGKHVAVKKEVKTDAVVQTPAPATNQ